MNERRSQPTIPQAPQSPAPVAGAVEALPPDVLEALGWLEKLSEPCWYADRLGPLNNWLKAHPLAHPQPAPAVAVEAERELFECQLRKRGYHYFDGKMMGHPQTAVWEFMSAGTEHAWQGWLAARSAPAVAEKVPLTEPVTVTVEEMVESVNGVSWWVVLRRGKHRQDDGKYGADYKNRAEWHAAGLRWILGQGEKPNIRDFMDAPPTVGSGSAQEGQA